MPVKSLLAKQLDLRERELELQARRLAAHRAAIAVRRSEQVLRREALKLEQIRLNTIRVGHELQEARINTRERELEASQAWREYMYDHARYNLENRGRTRG
jgi:hypothetical protein